MECKNGVKNVAKYETQVEHAHILQKFKLGIKKNVEKTIYVSGT